MKEITSYLCNFCGATFEWKTFPKECVDCHRSWVGMQECIIDWKDYQTKIKEVREKLNA